jgi:hypothetical protein
VVSLLGQLAPVNGVNHAVRTHQQFSLRVIGVDALRHGNNPDAGESQPLEKIESVGKASGEAGRVVDQDAVEWN